MKSVDEFFEKVNTTSPYVGSAESAGIDIKNRVSLLGEFSDVLKDREQMFGINKRKALYCIEGTINEERPYLELWDYLPKSISQKAKRVRVTYSRGTRVTLSKESKFVKEKGRIILIGKRNHIEIYFVSDWQKLNSQT